MKNNVGNDFDKETREWSVSDFDKETREWFVSRPYTETTVMQCQVCGLWYKPSLGHKCKGKSEK